MRNRVQTTAFFFDMEISTSASRRGGGRYEGLRPFTAKQVVEMLEKVKNADQAMKPSGDGKRVTYMQRVLHTSKSACLLISLSDKDAANPAFSNPEAKTRRVMQKQPKEGLEVSSHVVVNLTSVQPNTYAVVIESATGLPSSRIEQFINFNLRRAASLFPKDFMLDDPASTKTEDGKPAQVRVRVKVSLKGHPSKQLVTDINAGTLTGLELLQVTNSPKKWDQQGYVLEKLSTVVLDVAGIRKLRIGKNFDLLKEVCDNAIKNRIDQLRVQFKTGAGMSRTVLLDPKTQNVNDEAYVRRELLDGFNHQLEIAYEEINVELATRMAALIKAEKFQPRVVQKVLTEDVALPA